MSRMGEYHEEDDDLMGDLLGSDGEDSAGEGDVGGEELLDLDDLSLAQAPGGAGGEGGDGEDLGNQLLDEMLPPDIDLGEDEEDDEEATRRRAEERKKISAENRRKMQKLLHSSPPGISSPPHLLTTSLHHLLTSRNILTYSLPHHLTSSPPPAHSLTSSPPHLLISSPPHPLISLPHLLSSPSHLLTFSPVGIDLFLPDETGEVAFRYFSLDTLDLEKDFNYTRRGKLVEHGFTQERITDMFKDRLELVSLLTPHPWHHTPQLSPHPSSLT